MQPNIITLISGTARRLKEYRMHKLARAVALVAAPAVLFIMPAGALANAAPDNQLASGATVSGITVTGWIGSSQGGSRSTTTQYKASYTYGAQGSVTCAGVNQTGTSIASPYGHDSFTCTSEPGALGFTPEVGATGGWFSDFWALQGQFVLGTYTITATDGLTYWTGFATYS